MSTDSKVRMAKILSRIGNHSNGTKAFIITEIPAFFMRLAQKGAEG